MQDLGDSHTNRLTLAVPESHEFGVLTHSNWDRLPFISGLQGPDLAVAKLRKNWGAASCLTHHHSSKSLDQLLRCRSFCLDMFSRGRLRVHPCLFYLDDEVMASVHLSHADSSSAGCDPQLTPGEVFRQAFEDVQWPSVVDRKAAFSRWYALHYPERTSARGKRWYERHRLAKRLDTILRRLNRGENVRPQTFVRYGILYDKHLGQWTASPCIAQDMPACKV